MAKLNPVNISTLRYKNISDFGNYDRIKYIIDQINQRITQIDPSDYYIADASIQWLTEIKADLTYVDASLNACVKEASLGYLNVDTLADRNNIPVIFRSPNMSVYVAENRSWYRLIGGIDNVNWTLTFQELNKNATIVNTEYWVNVSSGNDENDGSQSNPWKTLSGALRKMESIISTGNMKVYFSGGDYHITDDDLELISNFLINKNLVFIGTLSLVRDNFTAVTAVSDNPFKRKSTVAWDSINQYMGYCARHDNYAPNYSYSAIGPHDVSTLSAILHTEGFWTGAIMEYSTNFILDSNRSPKALFGTASWKFQNCQISPGILNGNYNFQVLSTCSIQMANCRINGPTNKAIMFEGNVDISDSIIVCNCTNAAGVNVSESINFSFSSTFIVNLNKVASTGNGVVLNNVKGLFYRSYIYGFAYGIEFNGLVELSTRFGHYPNAFDTVGAAFKLTQSSAKWYYGESYGEHKLYLHYTNYLFSMNGATDGLHFVFDGTRLVGDPSVSWFVPSTGGLWNGNPTALSAVRSKPAKYIDILKDVHIYYPKLYPELQFNLSSTLNNNTVTKIIVGDKTQNKSISVDYTVTRGSGYRQGEFNILCASNNLYQSIDQFITNGESNVDASSMNFSVSFNDISTNLINIDASLNNNVSAIFQYNLKRMMI